MKQYSQESVPQRFLKWNSRKGLQQEWTDRTQRMTSGGLETHKIFVTLVTWQSLAAYNGEMEHSIPGFEATVYINMAKQGTGSFICKLN